jgi:lipid-A-disaccharide synthase
LLAGSRKSEAEHNFPSMLEIAARLLREFPGIRFLVPTTHATHPIVEHLLRERASTFAADTIEVAIDSFDRMVPRCDLCLTVSGTATLHVASFGVPMIVVYRASPFVWHAGGRWLVRTRTFALVNVLAKETFDDAANGQHIVPEFVPWIGSSGPVAELAIDLLRHPEKLQAQRDRLARLIQTLDRPGASMNVAKMAIEMMQQIRQSK